MEQRIADFLINTGLYGKGLLLSIEDIDELELFLEGQYKIDAYCPQCKTNRIFTSLSKKKTQPIGGPVRILSHISENDVDEIEDEDYDFDEIILQAKHKRLENFIQNYPDVRRDFTCARDTDHKFIICCRLNEKHIIKYGQFPSLADLQNNNNNKYKTILGKKYSDYNRGIGLHSHGVGAGSLVYLRRIFEDLIEEAHTLASEGLEWNEDDYNSSRMDKKIQKLKNYLPEYLVSNRKIYGILSKGIHELPEDLCLEIFPIVRIGIEFILDEKIEKEEQEKKKRETSLLLEKLAAHVIK